MTIFEKVERRMEVGIELMHLYVQRDLVLASGNWSPEVRTYVNDRIAALEKEREALWK